MSIAPTQRDVVLQAVARGWCHEANSAKEMDSDLAEAITAEVCAALAEQAAEQAEPKGVWRCVGADDSMRRPEECDLVGGETDMPAAPAAEQAPHPSYPHITQPYTLEEIRAQIASHDYSAELLLQHAMLLLDASEQAEPVAWQWLDTSTFRKRLPSNAEPGAWRPLYAANCIK